MLRRQAIGKGYRGYVRRATDEGRNGPGLGQSAGNICAAVTMDNQITWRGAFRRQEHQRGYRGQGKKLPAYFVHGKIRHHLVGKMDILHEGTAYPGKESLAPAKRAEDNLALKTGHDGFTSFYLAYDARSHPLHFTRSGRAGQGVHRHPANFPCNSVGSML